MATTEKNTSEWIKIAMQFIFYVIMIVVAYGALDKRVTVLETKQETYVNGENLQKMLKEWKTEIVKEMKEEFRNSQK